MCLLFGLEATLMAFNFSEETQLFNQRYLITPAFTLCTGPAFYLFVRQLVFDDRRWSWIDTLHAIPALLAVFFTDHTNLIIALGSISLLVYGTLAFRWLLRYRSASRAMSSAAREMRLDWLGYLMLTFALLGITDIIRLNLQPVLSYELANTWYLLHQSSVLVLYTSLIVLAVQQASLFDGLSQYKSISASHADQELSRVLFEQIDQTLKQQALYRQPRLSLNDVASALGIGPKDVSNAVNSGAGMSFCDYINGLRVEEVKQRLAAQSEPVPNFLSLGLDAGFNSKSSFNAVFKSLVGITPRQYLRNQQTK
ncbi:AraC-like DNA-binding protein [Arenicella xantha]|uniref:AraC-like DNA-binding protein n=1 Tax=Arenicella xantha TaxID=644221 RepID=A0A395JN85_9GAMM|nr:AraC-like DNA-binding protein [Arenicella xantha]